MSRTTIALLIPFLMGCSQSMGDALKQEFQQLEGTYIDEATGKTLICTNGDCVESSGI